MRVCEGGGCQSAAVTTISTLDGSGGTTAPKGKSICAKCCLEVGADGRVWCLACYGNEHDRDDSRAVESDEEGEQGKIMSLRNDSCIGVEQWLERCAAEPWCGG